MAYSKNRRLAEIISDANGNLSVEGIIVPTQSSSDNDTSAASTAFVHAHINAVLDSAPGTLNTLNEIAAALNDDANFNTTVTNAIAGKLPLAGGTLTGVLTGTEFNVGVNYAGRFNAKQAAADAYGIVLEASANDAWLRMGHTGTYAQIDATYNSSAGHTPLQLLAGGSARIHIATDGKVGIGTASPAKTLDVKGRIQLTRPVDSGHASEGNWDFNISHEDAARYGTLYIAPSVSTAEISLMSNKFRFTNDGKLGIGVTDPSGAPVSLSVYGSGTSSPSASNAATSYSNAMFRINHFGNSSVGLSIGSAGSNVTYIQSSYNEGTTSPLLINPYASDAATSFIGMGNVTSPAATVHIRPTGNAWEHGLLLQHDNANTGWNIHPEQQDDSLWFGYNANTAVGIANQTASEYLVLDSSGGVGIGNSRPTINAYSGANNLVIGNTSTANNGMSILGNANNVARIMFGDPDLNRSGQIEYLHNGDMLQFYTGNALSTRMTEGRLGIGVTPSEVFHTYAASGSNEYRNQLGSHSVYMRHGITRNTPQGANVFDVLTTNGQDIVIGTTGAFLIGNAGVHNTEGNNRLRVDGSGVTIGEVLPTLTTTNESIDRRLWVRGQGAFESQNFGQNPRNDNSSLYLGPKTTRNTSAANNGTAGYADVQPGGNLMGGISWDHLRNFSTYGNVGYSARPHGWLGMELHSTPGYELSNMVMATRPGHAANSETELAMRWYATGEITTPRNPAFTAYGSGLANQTTEGNHGTWNETTDRGANFTAGTNAFFTAPVDGLYAFWAQANFNTNSSAPYYWRAFKNTGGAGIFYGSGPNQAWDHIMAYIMIAMDKNDTFEWRYKGDPDEGAEWAQCGGYLVG